MTLFINILILFFSIQFVSTTIELTYEYTEGQVTQLQYTSIYNIGNKTPDKVVNIYTCEIARKSLNHTCPPRIKFKSDPRLKKDEQAVDDDYKNSGYTRGHLLTAKYFSFNTDAYHNTFFLTNVGPQTLDSNELWNNKDEVIVLNWAGKDNNCIDDVIIETALVGSLGTIGKNVNIPSKYLNSVCEPHTGQTICFWINNVDKPENVYMTTVDDCESFNSVVFFNGNIMKKYPKCMQHKNHIDIEFWGINRSNSKFQIVYKSFNGTRTV